MTLAEILTACRQQLLGDWLDATLANSFGAESAKFFRDESDPMCNPIGDMLREALAELFDRVVQPGEHAADEPSPRLERLMRLQAARGASASAAVGFLVLLKQLVHARRNPHLGGANACLELLELDGRIDLIMLRACDLFGASREQLAQLRVRESQRGVAKLVERLQRADAMRASPVIAAAAHAAAMREE